MNNSTETVATTALPSGPIVAATEKKPWITPTVTASSIADVTLAAFTGTGADGGIYS
jgi:hypothetical protein